MTDRSPPSERATSQNADSQPRYEALEKMSAGQPSLDRVLGGGIPRNSLYVLTGPPGAGKTILAQQISFAAARAGEYVIYFTNVSEPHAKLVQHMRSFAFFDHELLGKQISIYNITSQIRNKGFQQTLDFIVDTVRKERAGLVIIDSFRGLKHVLETSARDRGAIFDLAARMSIMSCTSILVGEYTTHEEQNDPEFAIADGIIHLAHTIQGVQEQRILRIVKMRGTRYLTGHHTVCIDQRGINVYPRQETLTQPPTYTATNERQSMGIAELDTMFNGGVIRLSSTLLAGSSGTGKTVISMHFLAAGVQAGEAGLMLSFQESENQLKLRASHFSIGQQFQSTDPAIHFLTLSPVELDIDQAAYMIREYVQTHHIRRIVIDSIAEIESALWLPQRFDDVLASLIGFFRENEITTVMTREIPHILGSNLVLGQQGLSYIVDNIVLLHYFELYSAIHRSITVLKSRGSYHEKTVREFIIEAGKVQISDPLPSLRGLLTGLPVPIELNDPSTQDHVKED